MPSPLGAINSHNIAPQTSFCESGGSPVSETGRMAIFSLTDNIHNDPVTLFKQNPHQTELAYSAVLHGMQKDLPQPLVEAELSPVGERVKNLVGVIYGEVKNSNNQDDIKTLDTICGKLIAAKGDAEKESKIKGQLAGLVTKYGTPAFEKTINTFIDNCAQAWQEHHDARSINVEDKQTFKACQDVCKSVLRSLVSDLNNPKLPWETIGQKMNQFVDACAAMSKTLTFHELKPASPAAGDPVPKGPASPYTEPGNKPDVQSLTLPAGPGNGPITLHITNTSTGGSVGDINNSSSGVHGAQSGLSTADLKEILASDLDKTDKVKLAYKYLELNAGPQRFLNKIESVGNLSSDVTDGGNPHRTETVQEGIEVETPASRAVKEPHWIKTEPDGFKETPTSRSAKEPHWIKTELDGIEVETPTPRSAKEPHWIKTELDDIEVDTPASRAVKEPHWIKTELDGIEVDTPTSRAVKEPDWIKTELDDIEVDTPASRAVKEPDWIKTELDGIEVDTPTSRAVKEPDWIKTELDDIEVDTPASRAVREPHLNTTEQDLLNDKPEQKLKREGFNPIRGLSSEDRKSKWPTVETPYLTINTTERGPDTLNRLNVPAINKTFMGSLSLDIPQKGSTIHNKKYNSLS